jgi:hypothetical protein
MAAIFAFTCSSCGGIHEGSPSFAFRAPSQYASLSEEQKSQYAQSRPSNVVTQPGGHRAKVTLHHRDLPDGPLSIDQARGITVAKAQELAERTQHGG